MKMINYSVHQKTIYNAIHIKYMNWKNRMMQLKSKSRRLESDMGFLVHHIIDSNNFLAVEDVHLYRALWQNVRLRFLAEMDIETDIQLNTLCKKPKWD